MKRNLMGTVMSLILLFVSTSVSVWAMDGPPVRGEKMGPPPGAIEACKGKTEGDAVEFTTPRGDKVRATCRLMAVPEDFVRSGNDGTGKRKSP